MDCNKRWTKDAAVSQMSSRDNQSHSFGLSWVAMSQKLQLCPEVKQHISRLQAVIALKDGEADKHSGSYHKKSTFFSEQIALKSHYEESQETCSFKISIEITN